MKAALLLFALAAGAWTQNPDTIPSSCGPSSTVFKVHRDSHPPALAAPAPGEAQIVFIHDAGGDDSLGLVRLGYPTSIYAIDGKWEGANHGDSWFSVFVAPGEHHVCTELQSSLVNQRTELAHLTAVTGQTYYFRTRLILSRAVELLDLELIDSDQGKYLTQVFALSKSTSKK
jgi:hypothetical protein